MRIILSLSVIALLLFANIVQADSPAGGGKLSIYTACPNPNSSDRSNPCSKLELKPDGSIVSPNKETMDVALSHSSDIVDAAKKFGVDPSVIIACIAAENTMNVGFKDTIQNALVSSKLFPDAKIPMYGYVTIGFGQINPNDAAVAEEYAAKLENRAKRTTSQVAKLVLTPEGSIYYVAAILRVAQDKYAAAGFDISQRPEILGTLYNIGKVDERVVRLKNTGAQPTPNYFGYFVAHYHQFFNKKISEALSSKSQSLYTKQSLNLLPSPDLSCVDVASKNEKLSSDIKASGNYSVLDRAVDCSGSTFDLVKFENGKMGWVDTLLLKDSITVPAGNAQACSPNIEDSCSQSIKNILDDSEILDDLSTSKKEFVSLKIFSRGAGFNFEKNPAHMPKQIEELGRLVKLLKSSCGTQQVLGDKIASDNLLVLQKLFEEKDALVKLGNSRYFDFTRARLEEMIGLCNTINTCSGIQGCNGIVTTPLTALCEINSALSMGTLRFSFGELACAIDTKNRSTLCAYSEEAVEKKIRKLAAVKCVEKIVSPDAYIVSRLSSEFRGKVVYGDIGKQKEFKIQLSRKCK